MPYSSGTSADSSRVIGTKVEWGMLVSASVMSVVAVTAPETAAGLALVGWALGCSIVVLIRARRIDGDDGKPWRLLSYAAFLISTGILARGVHGAMAGVDQPIPSPADLLHIPGYMLFFATALTVHRRRASRRDSDAWFDAAGLVLGLVIILWVGFLGDFAADVDRSLFNRVLNLTYNGLTLASLAVFLRITATPGPRPASYYFLGVAGAGFFFVDIAGSSAGGISATVALSPLVYALLVLAVIHPTAPELSWKHSEAEETVGFLRLVMLSFTILAPLSLLLVGTVFSVTNATKAVLVVLTVLLSGSVVVRVSRLLTANQRVRALEGRFSKEVAQLASLKTRADVQAAVVGSANRLLGTSRASIGLAPPAPGTSRVFALPSSLSVGSEGHALLISGHELSPPEMRLVDSLVRNADAIASSAEGLALSAALRSEAEANRRVASNEQRFRALVQNASDIVAVIGLDGEVTYVSEAVTNVLGYRTEAFLNRSLEWIVHENDWEWAREHFEAVASGTSTTRDRELRAIHADGSVRLFECLLSDMRHVEGIEGIVINATDATAKRSLERDLRDAETTDLLTLQLNRTAFLAETETAIRRSSVSGTGIAVAIINVDQFRTVNEGLGPSLADQVLIEIAQAIRRSVRMHDVVARLNGDEFGVLMSDGYSSIEAVHAVERIIGEVASPITVGGHTLTLRSTAGVVLDTDGSTTAVSLLRNADTALDVAKQHHRGRTVLFEESMGEAASERIDLRNTLETAIRQNQLRLAYQPLVSIKTGEIISMEALARWEHPTRGNISPATFIPIAESSGLITELGEWALRTACNQVVDWEANGMDGFTVSVNMSGHQLREENIINRVRHILEETGIAPGRITIEITESVLIDDTDFIAHRIEALRELGLGLAIDDFGTGYSSLSYLTRYEFDVLKIDRSFVIPLADPLRTREREIVKSMIDLARSLGAVSVAEGIEEQAEFETLQELGCDYAQGYLFWYPLELEQVAPAFAESRKLAA